MKKVSIPLPAPWLFQLALCDVTKTGGGCYFHGVSSRVIGPRQPHVGSALRDRLVFVSLPNQEAVNTGLNMLISAGAFHCTVNHAEDSLIGRKKNQICH